LESASAAKPVLKNVKKLFTHQEIKKNKSEVNLLAIPNIRQWQIHGQCNGAIAL